MNSLAPSYWTGKSTSVLTNIAYAEAIKFGINDCEHHVRLDAFRQA
jgi:hypothetical protein